MAARRRYSSSVPDITLPAVHNKDWQDIHRMLCVDESLNDSGAAFFIDGVYQPAIEEQQNVGLHLTLSKNASQIHKIVSYDKWLKKLITDTKPDVMVVESHPFMRMNGRTSIATLEVMIGVKYIAMLACASLGVPFVEFSTNSVKTIICGSASASKEAVQMILSACGYDLPKYLDKDVVNDNVCDAIAMGEVLSRMQKQEILRREYSITLGNGRPQTRSRLKPTRNKD